MVHFSGFDREVRNRRTRVMCQEESQGHITQGSGTMRTFARFGTKFTACFWAFRLISICLF